MAGVRAFIEQTAPEMTVWTNLKHKDEPYVKITPSQRALNQDDDFENLVRLRKNGPSLHIEPNQKMYILPIRIESSAEKRKARRRTGVDVPEA